MQSDLQLRILVHHHLRLLRHHGALQRRLNLWRHHLSLLGMAHRRRLHLVHQRLHGRGTQPHIHKSLSFSVSLSNQTRSFSTALHSDSNARHRRIGCDISVSTTPRVESCIVFEFYLEPALVSLSADLLGLSYLRWTLLLERATSRLKVEALRCMDHRLVSVTPECIMLLSLTLTEGV